MHAGVWNHPGFQARLLTPSFEARGKKAELKWGAPPSAQLLPIMSALRFSGKTNSQEVRGQPRVVGPQELSALNSD